MTAVPAEWKDLANRLSGRDSGTVYVAGAVDRGKSTLCRFLERELGPNAALLDLDSGQSTVGPPTTLGGRLRGAEFLRFVGSTSAGGHLLPILAGAVQLQAWARRQGAWYRLIDSPGYIEGGGAREFQILLLDLLAPDMVVALQESDELEPILSPFRARESMEILRWRPAPEVRRRSRDERQNYRRRRYQEYFRDGAVREIPYGGIEICGAMPASLREEDWTGRCVGLCDRDFRLIALGVVEGLNFSFRILSLFLPPVDLVSLAVIQVGTEMLCPQDYRQERCQM